MADSGARKQRPHRPRELGPRLYRSPSGFIAADFRYLGQGRFVLRDPAGTGWTTASREGEATESEEVARDWVTDYLRAFRREAEDRQLGISTRVAPSITLEQRAREYLNHRELVERVARPTWYNDQGMMRLLLEWFGGDAIPEQISADDLQDRFNELLLAGAAPSTCRVRAVILSAFFRWLGVDPNPARAIQIKGRASPKKYGWSTAQIRKLREAADLIDQEGGFEISARYALELALATGAREGELFGIEATHIDVRTRTCRIMQQVSRYADGVLPTKGRDARATIVLPDYWPFHRPEARGFLFTKDGATIRQGKERFIIDAIIRQAGIKQVGERSHMTRHTFARLFLEEYNGDLRDLQKFLGHKSLATTERFYGHYSVDVAIQRANERIYGEGERRLAAI